MRNTQEWGLFLIRFHTTSIVVKIIDTSSDENVKTVDNETLIWMNENSIIEYRMFNSEDYL
jgi:competence protein ComGF